MKAGEACSRTAPTRSCGTEPLKRVAQRSVAAGCAPHAFKFSDPSFLKFPPTQPSQLSTHHSTMALWAHISSSVRQFYRHLCLVQPVHHPAHCDELSGPTSFRAAVEWATPQTDDDRRRVALQPLPSSSESSDSTDEPKHPTDSAVEGRHSDHYGIIFA